MGLMFTYFTGYDGQPHELTEAEFSRFSHAFGNTLTSLGKGQYTFEAPENEVIVGNTVRRVWVGVRESGELSFRSTLNPPIDVSFEGSFRRKFLKEATPEVAERVWREAADIFENRGYQIFEFYYKAIAEDQAHL